MIPTLDLLPAAESRAPAPAAAPAADLLAHVLRDLALSYEAECPGGFARFRQALTVETLAVIARFNGPATSDEAALALARQIHETLLDVEEDVWALHTSAH
ncbi:hypothetical protein NS228_16535 [Methylobacterium indicum]|uniref:Uncharacterized protein n=1 Tax=Methylobacterium indicum TaxID=1775910 RepID=A0A0J6REQ4_9HYPH|nr:hypothetical protein [Methylobacterium indicum]KMO19884.1 hypothetical protein QR78_11740 [Methylobacterium indicum]KTS33934.1 hypothetical protein NS229_11685 [Methylobacterium indicum]KTS38826.1 hypothetical protein NS228_16535 [Methylobacterium indicum]KTS53172.1 hypothetical protein NS230_07360 [Methylobacterium indicum]BCM85086.1 hypothetical protein mvi_35470 [Methylobacterium indicum]